MIFVTTEQANRAIRALEAGTADVPDDEALKLALDSCLKDAVSNAKSDGIIEVDKLAMCIDRSARRNIIHRAGLEGKRTDEISDHPDRVVFVAFMAGFAIGTGMGYLAAKIIMQ